MDVYGTHRDINLLVMDEDINIGNYVIVHAGFAIEKLQDYEAKETLGYFKQYLEQLEKESRSEV